MSEYASMNFIDARFFKIRSCSATIVHGTRQNKSEQYWMKRSAVKCTDSK